MSSILDTYPRSYATTVHPLALHPGVVCTRHRLDLVATEDLTSAPVLDRLLVPGAPDASVGATADRWAAERGLVAERVNASGAYAQDKTLADMARREGNVIVRKAGIGLEYPTQGLQLNGPEWRLDVLARPLALGLIGLGALVFVRPRRRRPAASDS